MPSRVNKAYDIKDPNVLIYVEKAMHRLGELNAYSYLIPDVDFFIRMHINNEAVKSSRIEGTKTGIDEAILNREEINPEMRDDWQKVQNYANAMEYGIKEMKELPVCMRLLCGVHKELMQEVRGEDKQPGKFRKEQNWIGGKSIQDASFIPPHPDDVSDALQDWEKFVNNRRITISDLIQIAIAHYQFETIHPFNDGNGRTGRIAIILQLIEMGVLDKPTLYLSDFFEKHREKYYDTLSAVRDSNKMDQWILFFLEGLAETAKKGRETLQNIVALREEYASKVFTLDRQAKLADKILTHAFSHPGFNVAEIVQHCKTSTATANAVISKMVDCGMLKEITGYSRNRIFVLWEYLALFK